MLNGFSQPLDKLEFGGESPLTMRYERLVINQHPLGPLCTSFDQAVFVECDIITEMLQ